jgi:CysZ protein
MDTLGWRRRALNDNRHQGGHMLEGLVAVLGGIWFIITSPRLWPFALVPALLIVAILCAFACLGFYGAEWFRDLLLGAPETVWGHVGSWLMRLLLYAVVIAMAFLVALALAQPLSGSALEAIVRAQERALLGEDLKHSSFWSALWVSTRATLVMLVVGGIVYTALFIVDLCVPPAVVITVPLRFVAGAWLLAWNFLDYPLSMRGLGVFARLRWSLRHFDEFTVFGGLWAALLFLPGLFFLCLPMGVAGATRLAVAADLADAPAEPPLAD